MPRLTINGQTHNVDVDPTTPLLWVIRENVGLNGNAIRRPRRFAMKALNCWR